MIPSPQNQAPSIRLVKETNETIFKQKFKQVKQLLDKVHWFVVIYILIHAVLLGVIVINCEYLLDIKNRVTSQIFWMLVLVTMISYFVVHFKDPGYVTQDYFNALTDQSCKTEQMSRQQQSHLISIIKPNEEKSIKPKNQMPKDLDSQNIQTPKDLEMQYSKGGDNRQDKRRQKFFKNKQLQQQQQYMNFVDEDTQQTQGKQLTNSVDSPDRQQDENQNNQQKDKENQYTNRNNEYITMNQIEGNTDNNNNANDITLGKAKSSSEGSSQNESQRDKNQQILDKINENDNDQGVELKEKRDTDNNNDQNKNNNKNIHSLEDEEYDENEMKDQVDNDPQFSMPRLSAYQEQPSRVEVENSILSENLENNLPDLDAADDEPPQFILNLNDTKYAKKDDEDKKDNDDDQPVNNEKILDFYTDDYHSKYEQQQQQQQQQMQQTQSTTSTTKTNENITKITQIQQTTTIEGAFDDHKKSNNTDNLSVGMNLSQENQYQYQKRSGNNSSITFQQKNFNSYPNNHDNHTNNTQNSNNTTNPTLNTNQNTGSIYKEVEVYLEKRYCNECCIDQPIRTKHCHDCKKCVATYDHHCPWVSTCVGEKNRCPFWWFLLFQFVELIFPYVLIVQKMKKDDDQNDDDDNILESSGVCIFVLVVLTLFSLFVGILLIYHTYLAMNNLTTWEGQSWENISYLKEFKEENGTPFSKGVKENLRLYCRWISKSAPVKQWKVMRIQEIKEVQRVPVQSNISTQISSNIV